jgi:hypothetical protein
VGAAVEGALFRLVLSGTAVGDDRIAVAKGRFGAASMAWS